MTGIRIEKLSEDWEKQKIRTERPSRDGEEQRNKQRANKKSKDWENHRNMRINEILSKLKREEENEILKD